jgi:hypothetical protein
VGLGKTTVRLGLLCAVGCSSGTAKDAATDAGMLPCNGVSAAEACPSGSTCHATWSAVLGDATLCLSASTGFFYSLYDCGGYHVLTEYGHFNYSAAFYDDTSGALVAITGGGNFGPFCLAGPSTGFVGPDACDLELDGAPPPQCLADAGSQDGSRD